MAKQKSVHLTDLQRAYLAAIVAERNRIERDFQVTAGAVLAGGGVDVQPGTTFSFDGKSLVYSLPEKTA